MGLLDAQVPHPGQHDQPMLALTAFDLRALADTVESLGQVRGRVDSVIVGQHRIELERHSDQRDGDWYTVTAITRAERVTQPGQA